MAEPVGHNLVLVFAATRGSAETSLLRFEAENDEIIDVYIKFAKSKDGLFLP